MSKTRHSPWVWIPALSMAEEIPTAVITFVAVLMFVQFGASEAMASVFSGLLFVPWVLRSFVRSSVRNHGYFKRNIHIAQSLMFVCLIVIALYINDKRVDVVVLFVLLFILSVLRTWHSLLTRMYYNRMLHPRQQAVFDRIRMTASQSTLVLTYGVLIMVAGTFEVFFRDYRKAWAMESYLLAGVFFLVLAVNAVVLLNPRKHNPTRYESLIGAFRHELNMIERMRRRRHFSRVVAAAFFLLLPQGLMFNSRVFFLLAPVSEGGLECSIQDVGFAQGTVGVIAFSLGLMIGKMAVSRFGQRRMHELLVLCLTLSPFFYMLMASNPLPNNMGALCCMTFFAQLLFGIGLNVCIVFVTYVSQQQYDNIINYIYIPLVIGAMLVPMMLSGWLVTLLGYQWFFVLNFFAAPIAWLALWAMKIKEIVAPPPTPPRDGRGV